MNSTGRKARIHEKLKYFSDELVALKDGSFGYKLGFGLLLLILFPVFLIELLIVILFGKDPGLFITPQAAPPPVLVEKEVPESLRDLIPLARKYGVGDDGDRSEILSSATLKEISELEAKVAPRMQEISDWLDSFPERGITNTAAFFLYLGSACDEVPQYKRGK